MKMRILFKMKITIKFNKLKIYNKMIKSNKKIILVLIN